MWIVLVLAIAFASKDCKKLHPEAGLSFRYNESIAHAIHSMTYDVLERFAPGVKNAKVPTVNMNISSSEKVVWVNHPRDLPRGFVGREMRVVDSILELIDTPEDGLGPNWSPLERVVHRLHMEDLWKKLEGQFENTPKPSQEVCNCLYIDVEENGIWKAVKWVADHYESGTPITLLGRKIPKLEDSDTWKIWKVRLLEYYDDASMKDASMYLRCVQ